MLQDLLDDGDGRPWLESFGTVGTSATLNAVKAIMDSNPKCSDVIVTDDGSRGAVARGWVTNVIVTEKARV